MSPFLAVLVPGVQGGPLKTSMKAEHPLGKGIAGFLTEPSFSVAFSQGLPQWTPFPTRHGDSPSPASLGSLPCQLCEESAPPASAHLAGRGSLRSGLQDSRHPTSSSAQARWFSVPDLGLRILGLSPTELQLALLCLQAPAHLCGCQTSGFSLVLFPCWSMLGPFPERPAHPFGIRKGCEEMRVLIFRDSLREVNRYPEVP